jgi:hypothetical protein
MLELNKNKNQRPMLKDLLAKMPQDQAMILMFIYIEVQEHIFVEKKP